MHRRRLPAVLAALIAGPLAAQTVSPADRAGLEGSSSSTYPLGRFDARIQQLHADLPPSLGPIAGHSYRRDAIVVRGQVDAFTTDLEITLSMSPSNPATASRTFAANAGVATTVVLPRTTVSFPATQRPITGPAPTFELAIPYQVPFAFPSQGGVLCVDTVVFGNQTSGGNNRNFSVYLDAHGYPGGGRSEQPGFRFGQGCLAPGRGTAAYANLSLWHMGSSLELEVHSRNGIPDGGSGNAWPFLCLGSGVRSTTWPGQAPCALLTTTEIWLALSGPNDSRGSYDGRVTGWPLLPPGLRFFAQVGSVDLQTGTLALGDASALTAPVPAPTALPAVRIASGSDRTSPTGTVSATVSVTRFF